MQALSIVSTNLQNQIDIKNMLNKWHDFLDIDTRSIETYTKNTKAFLQWLAKNNIAAPERLHIKLYKKELKEHYKPNTVNAYLIAIKQFFKWAEQEGLYPNITKGIKLLSIEEGYRKDYLSSTQIKNVLDDIDTNSLIGLRDYAICALMATTGLRTSSIIKANIEDLRAIGDYTALYYEGKRHPEKTSYVKISPQVEKAIRAYLAKRGAVQSNSPLFASVANRNNGGRMTTRSISRIAKQALVNAGFCSERYTAHSFRHTAGTIALRNNVNITEVQKMLGHRSIIPTLIYAHAIDREKNNTELIISNSIFNETKGGYTDEQQGKQRI